MTLFKSKLPNHYYHLLWPLLIEQVFMMLIGNLNVYIYSLYSDQIVASIGISDQVMAIATMAMGIVSLGSTILFLQNADQSRLKYFQAVVRQTLVLNVVLALLMCLTAWGLGWQLMTLMQTPVEIKDYSIIYLQIVSCSLLFQGISTSVGAVLRAYSMSKISMHLSIVNTIIVILGNVAVIFMPLSNLSHRVIAIACMTVFTRLIGSCMSAWTLRRNLKSVWQGLPEFTKSDIQVGKRLLSLGIPSEMENVSYNISQAIVTAIIASLGTSEVSARIYVLTITAVVFTLSVAAGQAGQIMIGNYARENRFREMRQFAIENTRLFITVGILMNIIIALLGNYLLGIFTDNQEIIHIGRILLWMNVFYDPCRVGNEIMIAALNVMGEVRYPVKMGIFITYLLTVPLCYLFGRILQLDLMFIWLVFIIDEGSRLFLFIRRWLQLTKEKG